MDAYPDTQYVLLPNWEKTGRRYRIGIIAWTISCFCSGSATVLLTFFKQQFLGTLEIWGLIILGIAFLVGAFCTKMFPFRPHCTFCNERMKLEQIKSKHWTHESLYLVCHKCKCYVDIKLAESYPDCS
jgi:hypothetical protein